MSEPGIEIPLAVDTAGSEVTIERLAASLLTLTDKVDKLTDSQKKSHEAAKGSALTFGLIAGATQEMTRRILNALPSMHDLTASMEHATSFGSKFQNMSLQFNTSAEALQKLGAAGKPFGVSVDSMARSLNLLDRNFTKIQPQFKKFGIDAKSITGDGAERFLKIAEGIGKIDDPAKQAAASFALLKDRSGQFLKLIRDPEGMKGAIKDFEDFGMAVRDNAVGALDKLGNQKDLLGDIFTSMKTNILGAVASSEALQEAFRVVIEAVGSLSKWIHDNQDTIREWTNTAIIVAADAVVWLAQHAIPFLIDALTPLAIAFYTVKKGVDVVIEAFRLMQEVVVAIASGGGLGAVGKAIDESNKRFQKIADDHLNGVGKIVEANISAKNTAEKVAVSLAKMRDRIVDAASKHGDYAAKLKDTTKATEGLDDATRKAVDSLKLSLQGFASAEDIKKTNIALAELGGVAKLSGDVVMSTGEKWQKALAAGQELEGGVLDLANAYLEATARAVDMAHVQSAMAAQAEVDAEKVKRAQESMSAFGMDRGAGLVSAQRSFDTMKEAVSGDWSQLGDLALESFLEGLGKASAGATGELAKQGEKMRNDVFSGLSRGGKIDVIAKELLANADSFAKPFREMADEDLVDVVQGFYDVDAALAKDIAGVLKLREGVKDTVKVTAIFQEALSVAADAAQALGHETLGNLIGGMLSAAAAGEQAAQAFEKAATAKDKLKAGIAAVGAGIGVAGGIISQNKTELSGAKGAASGALQGAAFGSQFGPWGAAIGGLAGGLIGFFAGSKFRKIAKEAGKVLGDGLSKETIEKIQADSKKLGISIKNAALLNISTAIADTGKAASTFGPQITSLIEGIASGAIPAKEGIAELGNSFSQVADEALKAGTVGDKVMVGLIKRARELKVESPEMKAFVNEQLDAALEGVHKFVGAIATLSDEALGKLGKDSGVVFGAMFDALVSERGIVAAVDALKDDFGTLREKLDKALGTEAMEAILGPFGAAFATMGDEKLRPIFEGIDGITQAMKGLANSGFLSLDAFTAMQDATGKLFDEAIAGGADMKTALLAVAPGIQAAISAAEQFGVPLDDDTQRLKELAEQNGITFQTDPQQAMLDVMVSIAEVLGADIPESAKRAKAALLDLKSATPGEINVGGGGTAGGTGGPKNVQANVTVNMGINENPMAAADTAAAMRRQTVQWAAEAIEDRVPAIVAALEGS